MRVVVSLDDATLKDKAVWRRVVGELKDRGMDVAKELDVIGVVSGQVARSKRDALEQVGHVVKVQEDAQRHVPR